MRSVVSKIVRVDHPCGGNAFAGESGVLSTAVANEEIAIEYRYHSGRRFAKIVLEPAVTVGDSWPLKQLRPRLMAETVLIYRHRPLTAIMTVAASTLRNKHRPCSTVHQVIPIASTVTMTASPASHSKRSGPSSLIEMDFHFR